MQAGDLTDRVQIQKRSTVADGQGGRSTTWVDLVTGSADVATKLWAKVEPLRVGERLQAAAIAAGLTYRVVVRYRADVTEKMRIQWTPYKHTTAKTLEIHGVQPFEGGRAFLALECSETT